MIFIARFASERTPPYRVDPHLRAALRPHFERAVVTALGVAHDLPGLHVGTNVFQADGHYLAS